VNPERVLEEIEREGRGKGWPIIGPERGRFLDEAVVKHKPEKVLEVGTFVGYSAIRIGRLLGRDGRMTCLEVDPERADRARANIAKAGLGDRIKVVVGDAKETIPTVGGRLDLLFLDANKGEYLTYLRLAEPMLHSGSVVVSDNVKRHEVELRGYLEYIRNSGPYRSEKIGFGPTFDGSAMDAVEISVRV